MNKLYDIFPNYGRLLSESASRRAIGRFLPLYLWYALRSELALFKIRLYANTVRKKLAGKKGVKVNIAPGSKPFPGWINLDVDDLPGIDHLYDCRKDLPFSNESVDAIYCEHFFEHLEYSEEAQRFIAECRRVLRKGGIFRIVVPDAKKFLQVYTSGNLNELKQLTCDEPWFDGKWNTPMELINLVFRQGIEHKYAYDYDTISALLSFYGFNCEQKKVNMSSIPQFPSDTKERAAYSLYIEAMKGTD